MNGAADFHVQFQLLQINLITDNLLLCINLLSQNQNCGCVYWIGPIHTAGEVSLFAHYIPTYLPLGSTARVLPWPPL
jgi:hypothetical protein